MIQSPHLSAAKPAWQRHGYGLGRAKALLLTILLLTFPAPALADDDFYPGQQYVKYENDNVSVAFNNLRAADAALLMRSTTGVKITLPSSTEARPINLRLESAKVDYAVHSLLSALQLSNTFLVYSDDGHLTQVIALEKTVSRARPESDSADDKEKPTAKELTARERDSLVRDFGRWNEISAEEQKSIHARLRNLPPSKDRDQLIKEYVRLVLGVREPAATE